MDAPDDAGFEVLAPEPELEPEPEPELGDALDVDPEDPLLGVALDDESDPEDALDDSEEVDEAGLASAAAPVPDELVDADEPDERLSVL